MDLQVPQEGISAFGDKIFRLPELFEDENTELYVRSGLMMIFDGIGLEEKTKQSITEEIISKAKSTKDLLSFERETHAYLESKDVFTQLPQKTAGRADRMADLLLPFAVPGTVLDLGCGPGNVGKIFGQNNFSVTLADVYKNPNIAKLNIPFVFLKQNHDFPFADRQFNNVLILAMLHHTSNPLHTIKETHRILNEHGRLHLIETVYGVTSNELPTTPTEQDKIFTSLNPEQQRQATMFFDYFGNHVTWYYTEDNEKYVPVPFNFNKPKNWEKLFQEHGFRLISKKPLGIDPGSGVFHYLFIFES